MGLLREQYQRENVGASPNMDSHDGGRRHVQRRDVGSTSPSNSNLDSSALASEQRGLLDLIDKLQYAQLDNVKLPQIVVVGDQSAGKSSVLEALSGTPFPRDAGACTRFATEIRLRRDKETKLRVSIIPDKTRSVSEQNRLLQFGGEVAGEFSFETMMREATELIAPRGIPGRFAASDILVVEKSGPDMPLLTLVDLPGLVRVSNRDQSDNDIQTIEALSDKYMKSSRTIILAVVGGNNDYVQAPILKKARQFNPSGSRTIGVLTKPDMCKGIGLEDKFIELITNQDKENHFKLGWYVLLNPGPGDHWPSMEERERREAEFFSQGKWAALPPSMWGIGSLRQKLSTQLQRHIGKHVKSLRKQIQDSLDRCDTQLKSLGSAKDTVEEMRFEMGELFTASKNLVTPAVNGNYKNPLGENFFAKQSSGKGTPSQKLRARVREESDFFAERFRKRGRKFDFNKGLPNQQARDRDSGEYANQGPAGDLARKKQYAKEKVEPLLREIRGNELPLDSNPRAPYILFQDYSQNWPDMATEYRDNVRVICLEFLADLIDHVWPERMREPLRYHFLESQMKEITDKADAELAHLTGDMELEIQPFDPEYEERLRKWRHEAMAEGGSYTEAEEVLEKMLIYYELTARIFIRNVITQVVERHLCLGMLKLFEPMEILRMSNETIEAIAAENKETRERRITLKKQKAQIEEARNACASLAMRSELRGYEDNSDDGDSDDEGNQQYKRDERTRNGYSYSQPQQQHEQTRESRRPVQQPPIPQQQPPVPQQQPPVRPTAESYPSVSSAHRRESTQPGWDRHNEQDHYDAPAPPPRPSKVGMDDVRNQQRQDTQSPRRQGNAASRLADAMRFGSRGDVRGDV